MVLKSPKLIEKHEKSEHFSNMLSFSVSLSGFELVWIHGFEQILSDQNRFTRAESAENWSEIGVPESRNVDRCSALLDKNR